MGYLTLVAPICVHRTHIHMAFIIDTVVDSWRSSLQKLQVFFIGWRLAVAANNNEANETAVTRKKSIFTPMAGDEMVEEML